MRLTWGKQHFLLRFAHATLSLRHILADGDSKSVGVTEYAELPVKTEGIEPLPADATLVAAKEVELDELGICMPVLIFQVHTLVGNTGPEPQRSPARKNLKRRRQSELGVCNLYFFLLNKTASDGCALQFVNRVELPVASSSALPSPSSQRIGSASSQDDIKSESLVQVLLTHGPHVLVFQPSAQELSILTLRRNDAHFVVWRTGVKLRDTTVSPNADDVQMDQAVSCEFVDEGDSDSPHLLMHFASADTANEFSGMSLWFREKAHRWVVYPLSESLDRVVVDMCTYVPRLDQEEQWGKLGGVANDAIAKCDSSWTPHRSGSKHAPRGGNSEKHLVRVRLRSLADVVRVTDATKGNPSMTIVQAFSHVGDALVGECTTQSSADEILLLNHVEEDAIHSANEYLLVKKCVLICKKYSSEKYTIHRLRSRQAEETAPTVRGSKRSRSSREKDDTASVRYIERIKFGSKERKHEHDGEESDGDRGKHAVSQSQLVQLTASLEKRLENGIHELDRMKFVAVDKCEMAQRLNGFVTDQWWRSVQNLYADVGFLPINVAAATTMSGMGLHRDSVTKIELTTLVSASPGSQADEDETTLPSNCELTSLVSLVTFHMVEFLPSASLFRFQVTLRNRSAHCLGNAYVGLVSGSVRATGEGNGITEMQSSSSVRAEFHPESENQDGLARFMLETVLPPSFAHLRSKQPIKAHLWLHCSINGNRNSGSVGAREGDNSLPSSSYSDCSLLVAPVEINPHAFLFSEDRHATGRVEANVATREIEELLVLSSGTNLAQIFHPSDDGSRKAKAHRLATHTMLSQGSLAPKVIRPTFALANLAVGERELARFYLSEFLSSLPGDIYTMINPLRRSHLEQVQGLLQSICMEMVIMQCHSVEQHRAASVPNADDADDGGADDDMSTDDGADSRTPQQQWQFLTNFRHLQKTTDLGAVKLLHHLQKRANYHSMWYAAK